MPRVPRLSFIALLMLAACRDEPVLGPRANTPSGPVLDTRFGGQSALLAVDLGTVPPFHTQYSEAFALNDNRQIVGVALGSGASVGFLWEDGTKTVLSSVTDPRSFEPRAISPNGTIAGSVCDIAFCHAAMWTATGYIELGTLGGWQTLAFGINDAGQVAGYDSGPPMSKGFLWQNAIMSDLGDLGGTGGTMAEAINASGQIVGSSSRADSNFIAPFIWQNGVMSALAPYGAAYAINDIGAVAGEVAVESDLAHPQAAVWNNGVLSIIGTLPGDVSSRAHGINNHGQVVGTSSSPSGIPRAFLWDNGVMTELPTLGGTRASALDINNDGDIVGWSDTPAGTTHAVLWTASPPNRPPEASASGPYTSNEGDVITFDGSGSSDPDAQTLTYDWDFGDGSAHGSGSSPSHVYADDGTYTVTLVVSDGSLASPPATTIATVANLPPVPADGADQTIVVKRSKSFVPTFSDPGLVDGPWTYRVQWGDGTSIVNRTTSTQGAQQALSHTYNTVGTFTRRLTVTDKNGASAFDEAIVTIVPNLPPDASVNGPYTGNEGTAVAFSSAGTSDPNGDTFTYAWRFGDGGLRQSPIRHASMRTMASIPCD